MTKRYTNLCYFTLFYCTFLQLGIDGGLPCPSAVTVKLLCSCSCDCAALWMIPLCACVIVWCDVDDKQQQQQQQQEHQAEDDDSSFIVISSSDADQGIYALEALLLQGLVCGKVCR